MTVLNPLQHVDEHIMDDADLAGPLLFFFLFGMLLLLVSVPFSVVLRVSIMTSDSLGNHNLATSMVLACWGRCRYTASSTSCRTKVSTFTAWSLFWAIVYFQWLASVQ